MKRRSFNNRTKEERDVAGNLSSQHSSLQIHAEPRGETLNEKVREHSVKWERSLEVGLRIPIEKQKLNEKGSSSATANGALSPGGDSRSANMSSTATSARSSIQMSRGEGSSGLRGQASSKNLAEERANAEGESREGRMEREAKEKDKDKELADAWGMLGHAELRIIIKGQVATDTSQHQDTHFNLGYVSLNLAEFAPYPESLQHHHHHHHHYHQYHHSHHQHHHHPHQAHSSIASGSKTTHLPSLERTEIRRYLLNDSRTNATLKMTIEMSHVGGSREYAVPAVRRGLVVGGIANFMDGTPTGKSSASGSNSDAGGSTEGHSAENHRSGGQSTGKHHHYQSKHAASSMTSLSTAPTSNWPPNSVAKHTRIPVSNLKTELSHHDAARAIKEAGGHRMGFSFAAGAHHERPPEDVIDAIFNPGPTSSSVLMLTPTVSRTEKVRGAAPTRRQRGGAEDGKGQGPPEERNKDQAGRGLYPERPSHHDGVSPAEHPKDSIGKHLSRFLPTHHGLESRPGPDMSTSQGFGRSSKASEEGSKTKATQHHKRDSSTSTMKSILTNSFSSKIGQTFSGHYEHDSVNISISDGQQGSKGSSQQAKASSASSNRDPTSSPTSNRPNLVHWNTNVVASENGSASSDNRQEAKASQDTNSLIVPDRQLTSSPSLLPQATKGGDDTNDIEPAAGSERGSTKGPKSGSRTETGSKEDLLTGPSLKTIFNPPVQPPDVVRREAMAASDAKNVAEEGQRARKAGGPSKAAKDLTKEEAIRQGFKGAGWGTLDVGDLLSASSPFEQRDAVGNQRTPTTSMQT
jgi:hypothetical protein